MPRTIPRGRGKEKDWAEDVSIYVKLVCEALTDAKLLAAGPNGFWIWARGLLYAKQHLTDGVIPNDAMPLVAFGIPNPELEVSKLVTLRLWEPCEAGHRVPEKTWFKYHASAAHVNEISEVRREVGKKGGRPKLTDKTKLVSEKSNLQSEESKSARDPKPRAQSTEHRVQSTEHKEKGAASPPSDLATGDEKPTPPASPALLAQIEPPVPPAPAEKEVRAEDVPLPDGLNAPEFLTARAAWFKQRRRRRLSLREEYLTGMYARLLPLGPQAAAACLQHTISNDYDGVFPEKFTNGRSPTRSQPTRVGPGQRYTEPG